MSWGDASLDFQLVESVEKVSRPNKVFIVSNQLPVTLVHRGTGNTDRWKFEWDYEKPTGSMRSLGDKRSVTFVGWPGFEVRDKEKPFVVAALREISCEPVFLSKEVQEDHYQNFCRAVLWPAFHYLLQIPKQFIFDNKAWMSYCTVNKAFAEQILEVHEDGDTIWIHDYHLMLSPMYLRKRLREEAKIGFFLHAPFPSSEVFRFLRVREDLIIGLLSADLIGFHDYDYARHFLSTCRRVLGLKTFPSSVDYHGRLVTLRVGHAGIYNQRYYNTSSRPDIIDLASNLREKYHGKKIMIGVDDMDNTKGLSLKLSAFENLLRMYPQWRGNIVLIQAALPAHNPNIEIEQLRSELGWQVSRINDRFSVNDFHPVVFEEKRFSFDELVVMYKAADVLISTSVRDGFNLIPYYYIACQGKKGCTSLILSEFTGCSHSLSGAIRVNPYDVDSVVDAMHEALAMDEKAKLAGHERAFRYVDNNNILRWSDNFLSNLDSVHGLAVENKTSYLKGVGGFTALHIDGAKSLDSEKETVWAKYASADHRLIMLNYDGTLVPVEQSHSDERKKEVTELLSRLLEDPKNQVVIVSDRTCQSLDKLFGDVDQLGMVAETGFFWRDCMSSGDAPGSRSASSMAYCMTPPNMDDVGTPPGTPPLPSVRSRRTPSSPSRFGLTDDDNWHTLVDVLDNSWKSRVMEILQVFTERTDGSVITEKETSLLWNYRAADPDYGEWQAKDLRYHLENCLANEPVEVVALDRTVEVKCQGFSKGVASERILGWRQDQNISTDFILCIGCDNSDEHMFESVNSAPQTEQDYSFSCVIGRRPSNADYYLDDPEDAVAFLSTLAGLR